MKLMFFLAYVAAVDCDVANIVRVTGDCPLVDPFVIDSVIQAFNEEDMITVAIAFLQLSLMIMM